ncbi:pirin-like C-terminal cupin domain-containing protein [Microbulbifer taiwanensis]|uniref:pirin-like C-terminal cupin domain-containing protein n=1 Tax=Microbulbifer taiwanensis TaxID=986746 RepID=UPI00361BF865
MRVRVVLGESGGVSGARSPALPLTILDGQLAAGARYTHALPAQHSAWLYAVAGDLQISTGDRAIHLPAGRAVAIRNLSAGSALPLDLANMAADAGHFALFSGSPIGEYFVQQGPFVMSSDEELQQVQADYAAGRLGSL